ncbi:MAG: sigma-70 family RNA polymerase sigma factor [Pseudomonadota bacterium]
MGYDGPQKLGNSQTQAPDRPDDSTSAIPQEILDLYSSYSGELALSIRHIYGDGPPDPDDVAQEAFQRVIERGDLASIRNLKAFIWRTARNLVLTEKNTVKRREARRPEIERRSFAGEGDVSSPEKIIIAKEQLSSINDVLRRMPEKRRRALILHRLEGLSVAEVGRRLGIGRTAAAKHVSRAAAELNALLANDKERKP